MDTSCCDVIAIVYPKCEIIAIHNVLRRSLEQQHANIDMKWYGGLAGNWPPGWHRGSIPLPDENLGGDAQTLQELLNVPY